MRRLPGHLMIVASLMALGAGTPAFSQFQDLSAGAAPVPADVIYTHAHIATPEGWREAMAVAGGTILATGSEADLAGHRTSTTQIVDLAGKTVLPGMIDMHVHPEEAGHRAASCAFPQGSSGETVVAAVKACAGREAPGAWILGGQWDGSSLGKIAAHRRVLDAVAPNNPVALIDISLHSFWANSAALKAAGITRDTPNPPGGIIERDKNGEPTGVLRETAAQLLGSRIPTPSEEKRVAALGMATRMMLAEGITAYEEALMFEPSARAYAALADKGELFQHVRTCMADRDQRLIALRHLYARQGLDISCVKMILDGVPTDAHTAAMLEPYADADKVRDPAQIKGELMVDPATIAAKLTRYDAAGLTVKIHATGDAAVRAALDGIAAARAANGPYGPHHEISHANFVNPADIARAAALNVTFEFSPYVWFPSPPVRDVIRTVGPERMERFNPIRDALGAGVHIVLGSDWPVVPSMSPWVAIETLVTRQAPGGSPDEISPGQKLTVDQAVAMLTINAAQQLGISDRLGSLEPGKQADFIVLDRDIFTVPATTIHQTRVLRTVIAGKQVYSAK